MSGPRILQTVVRQASVAAETAHRPWPLPEAPWFQAQTRHDVLLAYWPAALDRLARLLPPELAVDTWDGEAWIGVAACRVTGLRIRGLPPLPGLSSFAQLEVFAPVSLGDRPGLWFFSLDLPKSVLVEAAKRAHRLPAYRAEVTIEPDAGALRLSAERDGLALRARYAATGPPATAVPGSLEAFLVERFALYTADGGRLYRAELHQLPWRLRPAAATFDSVTLLPAPAEGPPVAFFAEAQDVLVWPLEEIG